MFADTVNSTLRRLPPWVLYVLAPLPVAWLYYQGLTGGLGIDPVKKIEHQLGLWALQVLVVCLAVTPLRRLTGINLLRYRRAIGLIGFFYVATHLLTWLALDIQFLWGQIWQDILKRPYITLGMLGFVLMLPLAVTSNNGSVRRLGSSAWGKLHQLTYPAVLIGGIHYAMVVKGWQMAPLVYLAAIGVLLALRPLLRRRRVARQAA